MSRDFIALPSLTLGKPRVSDRTSDLESAILVSDSDDLLWTVHIASPALAREWAAAFTSAAELLEAMGPARFCQACGGELPAHGDGCPRRDGGAR